MPPASNRRRQKLAGSGASRSRSASRSSSRSRVARSSSKKRSSRIRGNHKPDDEVMETLTSAVVVEPEVSTVVQTLMDADVLETDEDAKVAKDDEVKPHTCESCDLTKVESLTANQYGVEEKDISSGMYEFDQLPRYMRDNSHILGGYRISYSFLDSIKSLFTWHNEFMNVWSHLGACVFFLIMLIYFISNHSTMHGIELANNYTCGYTSRLDRGVMFIKDMFSPVYEETQNWENYVFTYHESMPRFCKKYYERYEQFMKNENLPLDGQMPRNRFLDGELVIGPWDFPAQCKPLTKKIYSKGLAETVRIMLTNLDEDFRKDIAKVKKSVRALFENVPLNTSFRSISLPSADTVPDMHSVRASLNDLYTRMQGSVSGTQELANEAYLTLRNMLLPVAQELKVDPRALKHPLFLLKYLDLSNDQRSQLEIYPIVVYILSAMFCFSCSAFYHLIGNMSYETHLLLARVDFSGISLLIGGSGYAMVHYLFSCHPTWQLAYSILLGVLSLLTFIITVLPRFSGLKYRAARVYLFIGLGCTGVFPFAHKVYLDGLDVSVLFYILMTGVLYIGGAFIYITRFPEVMSPGSFDKCCSSHTIWHMFVVAGAMTHLMGILYLYNATAIIPCGNV